MTMESKNLKSISRRSILKVIGGGVIVAAAGGGAFLATRDPAKARQPWQLAGANESEFRRRALSYAILAPNPHNRQPWLVELVGDDEIVVFCDKDRHLPVTDPYDRQITIGLGAFIETLAIAASNDGYRADVTPFPDGEPMPMLDQRPVARVRLIKDRSIAPDPLFTQIIHRRSNKETYDNHQKIPTAKLAELERVAVHGSTLQTTGDTAKIARLRQIAVEAMRIEYVTPATLGESIDLMRIGKSEILANPDGIDIGGPFFETLALLGQMDRGAMRDPSSYAWKTGLDMILAPLTTGAAHGWLVTPGNSRKDQIIAGRDYVRLNLITCETGISIHPTSQALQEYEEMAKLFKTIHDELAVEQPSRVQMFVRMGYAPIPSPSPRWPYQSRLKKA